MIIDSKNDIVMVKKIVVFILFSELLLSPIFSQNFPKNETKAVVRDETRKLSASFADGLKEFYTDNFSSAESDFRFVISKNPQNDAAFFMLSKIRSANKDFAGAAYYLQEAMKIDKHNEWYVVEMAKVCDNLGDYKQSSKYWEEVCKLKPSNEFYLFSLADAYLNYEKYYEVIKVYDRLEKLVGKNDEITDAKKNIYLYLNDVKSAVAEYDKLIKEFPYEVKYYIQAGNIYLTNNMPDKAFEYFQNALKIDKDNPYVYLSLANYYQDKNKEEESFKSLLTAFKSDELEMEEILPVLKSYFSAALTTKDEKNIKKTRQLVDVIIVSHPDALEGWATLAGLQLLKGSYEDARISLEKALSVNSTQYTIWEDYLFVLSQLKDYQTIANNEAEISELFPTNAVMLYSLGMAFQNLKQPDLAVNYLNQAAMYAFETSLLARIYFVLGDAYFDLKNYPEAISNWKLAQKKGLSNPEISAKIENAERLLK